MSILGIEMIWVIGSYVTLDTAPAVFMLIDVEFG